MILPEAADFPFRESGTVKRSADATPKVEAAAAAPGRRRALGDAPDHPHNGPTSTGWLSRHSGIVGATALIALVFAAYWPLLHAPFMGDDIAWVVRYHYVHRWSGLWHIWTAVDTPVQYYPLMLTGILLQYKIWGASTVGFHLSNMVLQSLNAILLWQILKRLGIRTAWLIAAVFAIHPVQVETLWSVMEQKNLLSAFFYFAAILAWIRCTGMAPDDNRVTDSRSVPRHRPGWYLLATIFYLLALLAKTDVCTLPAVLLLLTWWRYGRVTRRDILAVTPWFMLTLLMAGLTTYTEQSSVGAHGAGFHLTLAQRLLVAGRILWFYPLKLLWPQTLLIIYPRWHVRALGGWEWLFPAAALAVPAMLLLLRRRISRGPFVAVAFYGITASPVLGFISFEYQLFSFVADHFQYLPCIGLIALATESFCFLVSGFQRWRQCPKPGTISQRRSPPRVRTVPVGAAVCGGVVVLLLACRSNLQSGIYLSPVRVWKHVLKYNPRCPPMLESLALHRCKHGDIPGGIDLLQRAFHSCRRHFPVLLPIAAVDLGNAYSRYAHNYAAAVPCYRLALQRDPLIIFAIVGLVQCYEHLGQWPRAFATLQRGLGEFPHSVSLHLALANALAMRGDYRAAAFQYRLIVQAEPHNAKALYNLAVTLQKLGKTPAALATYQQALRWAPRWARAYFMYGQCLLAHGQPLAAAGQFRQAIAFAPAYPPIYRAAAYQALARALAAAGHAHQATAALARAAQLQDHKRISSERPLVKMPR